jgi:hypothetical protein
VRATTWIPQGSEIFVTYDYELGTVLNERKRRAHPDTEREGRLGHQLPSLVAVEAPKLPQTFGCALLKPITWSSLNANTRDIV